MKDYRIYVVIPIWGLKDGVFDTNNFFINQALALKREGQTPVVISVRLLPIRSIKSWGLCKLSNQYELEGVKICVYDLYVPIPVKFNKMRNWYISAFYDKIIQSHIFEDDKRGVKASKILHAHVSHECAYYCLKFARRTKVPLVVTEHYSGLLSGTISKNDGQRVKKTIENADKFIFVGTNFKEHICKRFNIQKDVLVVPNMVNEKRFYIDNTKREDFWFLCAGTLKKIKSMDIVIQAFNNEFKKSERVKLMIAGEGVERKHLEDLVQQLGETNRIVFRGEYQKEDAGHIFSQSDAFVLTGKYETFGIVYVEAMFCGLPCIGTKGQGADDIITKDNGFLVDYGDISSLQSAMRYIYENIQAYDKYAIRNNAIKCFTEEKVAKRLINIYYELSEGLSND